MVDSKTLATWIMDLIMDMEEKPYTDTKITDKEWIRVFDLSITESDEYIWHRDYNDRRVTVLDGNGWQFQFDNEMPFFINKGNTLFIPELVYHRLIPGTTNLRIMITEF